jgi:hypothetical protein
MKKLVMPIILLISLLHHACCDKESNNLDTIQTIDCDLLNEGLIFGDEDLTEKEINELCEKYPPLPVPGDDIGHKENLDSIIDELNTQCSGFVAELGCYACLESLPPQSVIGFTLDSAGIDVKRHVHLYTPDFS